MLPDDPDSYLVRGEENGWTNLAIGEPYFLRPHLQHCFNRSLPDVKRLTYPPHGGCPELLEQLRRWRHPGQYVVVANGAKQALLAAFYAFRTARGCDTVHHDAPYWPSFPTLAHLSEMYFMPHRPLLGRYRGSIYVKALPNNPDGKVLAPHTNFDHINIVDAAYAHPVYGWTEAKVFPTSVWSAGKLLGLSGIRVGWLATKDADLASLAADYVEKTTSGVNVEAQLCLAHTLSWMDTFPESVRAGYSAARKDLLTNGAQFMRHIAPYCKVVDGLPLHGRGMFAWFRTKDPTSFRAALAKACVLVVPGRACGERQDGWFRMSMGHRPEVTAQALAQLGEELRKAQEES